MIEHLLDTNILSELVRNPRGKAALTYRSRRSTSGTSVIVAAEVRYGLRKSRGFRLAGRAEEVLNSIPILPFEPPADRFYADIRAELTGRGVPLSPNDYWIAAHALALDCTLVTANEREFRRVPGLKVENWLA